MIRRFRGLASTLAPLGSVALFVVACSSSDGEPGETTPDAGDPDASVDAGGVERPAPSPLPALSSVPTTLEATLVPTTARQSPNEGPNPADPTALQDYLNRGFGELAAGPGEPYNVHVIDGTTPPAAGPAAKRLVHFTHLTDLQIADDESPTRLGIFDSPEGTASALRAEDEYLCRMANAAVRSINVLHAKDPMSFTLMGGDNADSAQTNEVDWVLGILTGSPSVKCDSGQDDDVIPGPDNDGKDPFIADGLKMPWRWVTGNHDVLVQGNLPVNATSNESAIGSSAPSGTRDYTQGGKVVTGEVIADPQRALLDRTSLMSRVAANGDGHGLADVAASGRATYTFDVEGTPLRFLVIDTAHETGGAEGVITQREIDRAIKPALDKAQADGKYVILASHHATSSLSNDGGIFGSPEPDALETAAWQTFVGQYPNVIFSMVGHSHLNRVSTIAPPGGHPWFEVMSSAIADFPHQFRTVEIFDQDNGWLMMRATMVNFSVEGDPVAAEGRRRGVVDLTSGWVEKDGSGVVGERNVELWVKKP